METKKLKKEAEYIAGYWNGKDSTFIDGNGIRRTEEDADTASSIMDMLEKIEEYVKELNLD